MPPKRAWAISASESNLDLPGISAGGGLAAFFIDDAPVDLAGSRKKRKLTEDVIDEDDEELERHRKDAEVAQMCSITGERARRHAYELFKAGWAKGDELALKKGEKKLRLRIGSYVIASQHGLAIALRKSRREFKDEHGKTCYEYCRVQSLRNIAHAMGRAVEDEWPLEKRRSWASILNTEMGKYIEVLARDFRLNNEGRRKGCLWAGNVAVLIAEALETTIDGDAGVAYAAFLCMLVHAACRPSTLIPAKMKDFYMTWDDIELVPRRVAGQKESLGWDVFLKLKNFKGYGWAATATIARVLNLQIRTVSESRNKLLDLGGLLAVLGVRMGIWGEGVTR
jgi:hypothetical protein